MFKKLANCSNSPSQFVYQIRHDLILCEFPIDHWAKRFWTGSEKMRVSQKSIIDTLQPVKIVERFSCANKQHQRQSGNLCREYVHGWVKDKPPTPFKMLCCLCKALSKAEFLGKVWVSSSRYLELIVQYFQCKTIVWQNSCQLLR